MTIISNKRTAKARKIIAAALTQLEQHGFQATSLEQIAAQAGVGKSTLYEYFKNKEELFTAAIEEASDQWFAVIDQICSETDKPIERLERVAAVILGFEGCGRTNDQRLFIEILMQTIMVGGVFYQRGDFIHRLHQRVIRIVTNILLEGVSQGYLRPEIACHAETLAINFLAYLDGMKYFALVAVQYIDVRAQIRFFMDHLTPSLLKNERTPDTLSGGSKNEKLAN
jgi:AcrR family transcriptional regulator